MRDLSNEEEAASQGYALGVVWLVEIDLAAPVYVNSSIHDLKDDASGITYLGRGGLGSVEDVADTAGEFPQLKFSLSGVPDEYIALADSTDTAGAEIRAKVSIVNLDTLKILDARTRYVGYLEPMTINDGAISATLEVIAESAAYSLLRPTSSLFTDAEQQRLYPGDLFFQFAQDQAEQRVVWPSANWGRQ